ncbi:MAG: hypothetical protein M3Z95_03175 [Actinomycetota bacterium]|nr:hypothetical protein [Actinomycetota bacterium]
MNPHPDTLAISTGRPPAVPDGPLNMPIAPAAALHPGGASGYARDGHRPWSASRRRSAPSKAGTP